MKKKLFAVIGIMTITAVKTTAKPELKKQQKKVKVEFDKILELESYKKC